MPTARRPGQPRQVRGQGQDRSTRAAGHCFRRAARAVRWLGDNGSPPTTRTPPPKFGLNDSSRDHGANLTHHHTIDLHLDHAFESIVGSSPPEVAA
jgi:hypothetical protein